MKLLIEILTCAVNACLMVYTFLLFFDSFTTLRTNKKTYIPSIVAITAIFTMILLLVPLGLFRTILLIAIPICTSFLYKFKWYNHILFSLFVFVLGALSELITTALLSTIFSISPQIATEGIFKFIGIVLSKMIAILIITVFKLRKYKLDYSMSFRKTLALFLVPLSAIIVVFVHVYWFIQIPYQSEPLVISNIVSYLVLVISNVLAFQIIDTSYQSDEKDKQLATAQELIRAQEKQYKQMQEHNATILKMKHDHKNYLIGLISELENGNVSAALSSLYSEQKILLSPTDTYWQNTIMTTVIKSKAEFALSKNIVLNFTYNELQNIQISHIDIAILLGNAIDNAIEATDKIVSDTKTIDIFIKVSNDLIIISIKNPVVSNVDVDDLTSTKRKNGSHGFGIVSMKNIAHKYGGEVIFSCNDNIFDTYIVLRNQNN